MSSNKSKSASRLIAVGFVAASLMFLIIAFATARFGTTNEATIVNSLPLVLSLLTALLGVVLVVMTSNRVGRVIWRFTGSKPWRILSIVLVVAFLLELIAGSLIVRQKLGPSWTDPGSATDQESRTLDDAPSARLRIPVRFLPDYDIEYLEDGQVEKRLIYGHGVIEVSARDTALILIDTWENAEKPMLAPEGHLENTLSLLEKARAHGVTVIHAPSVPVVEKYPQYHALKSEVSRFFARTTAQDGAAGLLPLASSTRRESIYEWPPSEFRLEVDQMRQQAEAEHYLGQAPEQRDIAWFLRPHENEYVVWSQDEFRYVLWKKGIRLVLYAGGATNECILHRPAGILGLADSDIVIVLVSDCTSSSAGPSLDQLTVQMAFEDYIMRRAIGGYVAESNEIVWDVADELGSASTSD